MNKVVDIYIKGENVIGGGVVVGAAGSHDDVTLRLTFDDKWSGLTKKVLFQNAYGENTVFKLLGSPDTGTTNIWSVDIPAEPKEFAGKMLFGVKGYEVDGQTETKAVMAVKTGFIVLPSLSDEDAESAQAPTPTIAEQLQAAIDDLDGRFDTAEENITPAQGDISDLQSGKQDKLTFDDSPTQDSANPVKSGGVYTALSGKQNTLTFDGTPTENSTNPVTSGGIWEKFNDVQGEIDVIENDYATKSYVSDIKDGLDEDIDDIEAVIPSQASSSNKLADKNFVNSSIATETAHYISNSGNPFTSVSALEAYAGAVTNNDYAFVTGTDSYGNTYYDRYKASVSGSTVTWAKEYRLNNSSFTAEQWAAISSGITAVLVASIADKYEKPSGGIPKTDLSSGVQASLDKADTAIQDISGKQDKFQFATVPANPQDGQIIQLKSSGKFAKYDANEMTWDELQVDNHDADVSSYYNGNSGLSATAVQGAIDELASEKQDAHATVSQSAPSAVTLADNTVYYLTNVTELALTYPSDTHWECLLQVTFAASGNASISFDTGTKYIGAEPTFGNSEKWEISIRDGIAVCGKAVSASV